MADFKYRMQNILNIQEKLESQAKAEFAAAQRKYQEEQDKLQELLLKKARYDRQLKELMDGVMDLEKINQTKKAVDAMKVLVRRQMVEVHKAEKEVERARNALNTVMQERKMHEKLKEKAYAEYQQEERTAEGKAIDGLVSFNYSVKQ
jgi:flagellar FliJ protein